MLWKEFIRVGRLSVGFTYLNVSIGDKCRQNDST